MLEKVQINDSHRKILIWFSVFQPRGGFEMGFLGDLQSRGWGFGILEAKKSPKVPNRNSRFFGDGDFFRGIGYPTKKPPLFQTYH